ncbi:PKD domain-containing protein [Arcticibacterium luteifluviistationis]|nr:PKD domain-containing protein [Arcticibacterium luteifluviistationis]
MLTLAIFGVGQSWGQFYVSPKACVVDITSGSDGALEGCPNATYFFDTDLDSESWVWDFGDITNSSPSTTRNPQFFYSTPGDYQVSLTKVSKAGDTATVTRTVSVGGLPQQPKFNDVTSADTTVCDNGALTLDPFKLSVGTSAYTYLWFPGGETTKTIDVDSSGCYSVEVFGPDGCSRTAKINVKFCYEEPSGGGGNEKWFFGEGATLEFQSDGGVEVVADSLDSEGDFFDDAEVEDITISPAGGGANPLRSDVATAMVYGPSGSLAFYSDGKNIYDANDEPILDANGVGLLNGNNTASQGLSIIPKSNCTECPHHQYYVFSKDVDTGILSYSVIDLRYNEGMGQIVERDVPIAAGITDKVTVLPKSDETGFDIFTHQLGNNTIQIIGIDSVGIQTTEKAIGIIQEDLESSVGYTVFNEQGTQMAQAGVVAGQNVVQVLTYDPETSDFSNPITVDLGISAPPNVYGLSFSPDGRLLYATISGDPANGETSYLLQIPIFYVDPTLIQANIITIDESDTQQFGALQLGPVNPNSSGAKYLYMAVKGSDRIAYLQAPDEPGNAELTGYEIENGTEVNGIVGLGLPSVIYANQVQDGGGASANYSGNCFNAATALEAQGICDPMRNEISWEFEDGTTLEGKNVNYTFPKLGWNKIKVIIKVFNKSPLSGIVDSQVIDQILEATETECTEVVLIDSIYIKPSPISSLPDFAYVCTREIPVKRALLYAAVTGGDSFIYSWGTAAGVPLGGNASDSIQEVIAPSVYTLEVENNFGCFTEDDIEVVEGCEPRVFFPNAFTPIGANPKFKVQYAYLDDVNLKVFNRWGELVFETDNLDIQWDGRVKGKIQAPTLYPYVLTYKALDFPERGFLKEIGSVWVLK